MHKDVSPAWGYSAEAGGCGVGEARRGWAKPTAGPWAPPGGGTGAAPRPELLPASSRILSEYATGHPCLHGYQLLISYYEQACDIILFTPHMTLEKVGFCPSADENMAQRG